MPQFVSQYASFTQLWTANTKLIQFNINIKFVGFLIVVYSTFLRLCKFLFGHFLVWIPFYQFLQHVSMVTNTYFSKHYMILYIPKRLQNSRWTEISPRELYYFNTSPFPFKHFGDIYKNTGYKNSGFLPELR